MMNSGIIIQHITFKTMFQSGAFQLEPHMLGQKSYSVKSIILPLSTAPRIVKQSFLVLMDFLIFPILIWLCYAIRLVNLGVEAVPNIPFGPLWVAALASLILVACGVYKFIVRTFNEALIVKLALATSLTVFSLYLLAYLTPAFIPMSIPLMFGFMMFAQIWRLAFSSSCLLIVQSFCYLFIFLCVVFYFDG